MQLLQYERHLVVTPFTGFTGCFKSCQSCQKYAILVVMKTALFIVGSFRAKPFNRQLANEAGREAPADRASAFADFIEA